VLLLNQRNGKGFTLEQISRLYPLLYSGKHLSEWSNLFDERATMVIVKDGAPLVCQTVIDGMPEQMEYAAENEIFVEEWHDVEIRQYGHIAVMKADYVLTADHEIRKGVDVLTLCHDERGWLITNLTFEEKELIHR